MGPWISLTGIGLILNIFNTLRAIISLTIVDVGRRVGAWRLLLPCGLVLQERDYGQCRWGLLGRGSQ